MILFVWIEKYNNINKLGFNFTSKFDFKFEWKVNNGKVVGDLTYTKLENSELFESYFYDIKAFVGKNGTGKSSAIFATINNILTSNPKSFTGFIVTDKYIFNRSGITINNKIKENFEKLKVIKNADICNYNRYGNTRQLTDNEADNQYGYKIIDSYLSDYSIFYYSPLLNYDRIYEGETAISENHVFEVDGFKYFDLSTESQIHIDAAAFNQRRNFNITSVSETLCHKSKEAERILNYLIEKETYPFNITIPSITISFNQFETNFWTDISRIFARDKDITGPIENLLYELGNKKMPLGWLGFKEEFYKRMLFSLLTIELEYRYSFGSYKEGNALTYTIDKFLNISKKSKTLKNLLKNYITNINNDSFKFPDLFIKVERFLAFINQNKKELYISPDSITVQFSNRAFLIEFKSQINSLIGFVGDNTISFLNSIFSYDFSGLSSGEKSMLHFFSRFHNAFKYIDKSTKNILIFLDEPEVGYHPQWQKEMISKFCDFFKEELSQYKVQIVITGHSPIIISDLPKENIVFLDVDKETKNPIISSLASRSNTFGANIHSLYSDAFFLKDNGGAMGDFAKGIIKKIITELNKEAPENAEHLKRIIDLIGEPLIQNQLLELFYKKFPEQRIEDINERIAFLERQLLSAKEIKKRINNEKS